MGSPSLGGGLLRSPCHDADRVFFTRLGLIRPDFAVKSALLSATIFLSGRIIGTCHHLYSSGTPAVALAFGSVFSALEVVPLTMIAPFRDGRSSSRSPRSVGATLPMAIYFLASVAFWNMVGAGLFGFLINPPIALYYMQGLNTPPLNGHAALFGTYGMLGTRRRSGSHAARRVSQ